MKCPCCGKETMKVFVCDYWLDDWVDPGWITVEMCEECYKKSDKKIVRFVRWYKVNL